MAIAVGANHGKGYNPFFHNPQISAMMTGRSGGYAVPGRGYDPVRNLTHAGIMGMINDKYKPGQQEQKGNNRLYDKGSSLIKTGDIGSVVKGANMGYGSDRAAPLYSNNPLTEHLNDQYKMGIPNHLYQ